MKALIHSSAHTRAERLQSSGEASNDREKSPRELAFASCDDSAEESSCVPSAPPSDEERCSMANTLERIYEVNQELKAEIQRLRQSEAELKARCEEFQAAAKEATR